MPTIGPDNWSVELTAAELAELEVQKKAWVDSILGTLKPGEKLIFEMSNETGHFDLETGEYVMDSYTTDVPELRHLKD